MTKPTIQAVIAEMRAEVDRIGRAFDKYTVPSLLVIRWANQLAALAVEGEEKTCDGNHRPPRCADPQCWQIDDVSAS